MGQICVCAHVSEMDNVCLGCVSVCWRSIYYNLSSLFSLSPLLIKLKELFWGVKSLLPIKKTSWKDSINFMRSSGESVTVH